MSVGCSVEKAHPLACSGSQVSELMEEEKGDRLRLLTHITQTMLSTCSSSIVAFHNKK